MTLSLELLDTCYLWVLAKQLAFLYAFHIFLLFLVTPCLVVNVLHCIEWIVIKKSLQSLPHGKKQFFMFVVSCTNIWTNFILILPKIIKKQLKVQFLTCSNVYNDVADFKASGFTKNTKILISWKGNMFS